MLSNKINKIFKKNAVNRERKEGITIIEKASPEIQLVEIFLIRTTLNQLDRADSDFSKLL
jgi:hypothetical protein